MRGSIYLSEICFLCFTDIKTTKKQGNQKIETFERIFFETKPKTVVLTLLKDFDIQSREYLIKREAAALFSPKARKGILDIIIVNKGKFLGLTNYTIQNGTANNRILVEATTKKAQKKSAKKRKQNRVN